MPPKTKLPIKTEHEEQVEFVTWFKYFYPEYLIMSIPNGSNKSRSAAAKFNAEGLLAGAPDLFVPVARGGYHGLFIEMKRLYGGVVSERQKAAIAELRKAGYCCLICPGADTAKIVTREYMSLR